MLGEAHLLPVHPTLKEIAAAAYRVLPFVVVDGERTVEEQKLNIAKGVSWTMNSKHLRQSDGFVHAIDLAPIVNGKINWKDTEAFCVLAGVMKYAAFVHNAVLRWGGDWDSDMVLTEERKRDYGHFEIVL